MKRRPSSASSRTSVAVVWWTSVITMSPVPDRLMSYDGCCAPPLVSMVRPSVSLKGELIRLVQRHLAVAGEIRRAAEARDEIVREIRRANAIRLLRRFGLGGSLAISNPIQTDIGRNPVQETRRV